MAQENFDPSLVPVSSIVTLAKVAQKLVNGNGTLTNPGNLQIGKDNTAPGSLTVTGPTAIGTATPPVAGDPTLKVAGNTNISGTLDAGATTIIGNSTVTGSLGVSEELTGATLNAKNGTTNSTYKFIPGGSAFSGGVSANALNLYAYGTNGTQNIANFNDNGTTELFGNTSIGGTLGVTGATTLRSTLGVAGALGVSGNTTLAAGSGPSGLKIKNGITSPDNTKIEFGDGSGWRVRFQQSDSKPIMDIYDNQNVDISGNLNVTGDMTLKSHDVLGDLYRKIYIEAATWNSSYTSGSDAGFSTLRAKASAANNAKTYKFDYVIGTDSNGNVINTGQNRFTTVQNIYYYCGLLDKTFGTEKRKQISESWGDNAGKSVTIDCSSN